MPRASSELKWYKYKHLNKHTKAHSKEGTLLDLSIFGRLIAKFSVLSAFILIQYIH